MNYNKPDATYIDPQDLMVGDYVCRLGYGIGRVIDVSTTSIQVALICDDSIVTWAGQIEPIRLTAGMLENNGFRVREQAIERLSKKAFKSDDEGLAVLSLFGDKAEIKVTGFKDRPCKKFDGAVRFVHEFQHALRICGLKDPANNFKI